MSYYTDDPIRDFEKHDRAQQDWLDSRPKCHYCKEPIQDDYFYEIDECPVCEVCLNWHFKRYVET